MADEAQGTVAPAVPAETPAEKPRVRADELPPDALKARLEQAKATGQRELLESLGVKSPDEIKALVDERRHREEAQKTLEQRAAEQATALKAEQARADAYLATISSRANVELAALSDAQRAAVKALAGEDPAAALKAIDALKPTWASAAVAPEAPTSAPPPPPVQTSTAPRPNAPPEAGVIAQADVRATYESLKKTNPFQAAAFAVRNAGSLGTPTT